MAYNGKDVNIFHNGFAVSGSNPFPVNSTSGMLVGVTYDAVDIQQTSATVETYVFKSGGLAGTTVKTIVITYTDSTKANMDTVVAT